MTDILTQFFGNFATFTKKEGRKTIQTNKPDLLAIQTKKKFHKGHGKNKIYGFRTVKKSTSSSYDKRVGDVMYKKGIYRVEVRNKVSVSKKQDTGLFSGLGKAFNKITAKRWGK
jgi:hypothetical protein